MVKWIGEKTADFLLAFLLGIIPLIVIRDFERERRIATMEAKIVGEPRIVALEKTMEGWSERQRLAIEEIMRLRTSVTEILLPIVNKRIDKNETSSSNSRFDVEPLPDGEPE